MKATRLNDIENLLEEQNTLSINHLCEIFNVSKNTIRRDIAELEKRGTIKKSMVALCEIKLIFQNHLLHAK